MPALALAALLLSLFAAAVTSDSELSLWPMPAATTLLGPACLTVSEQAFEFKTDSSSAILRDALARYKKLAFLPGGSPQPCSSSSSSSSSTTLAPLAALSITVESDDETLGPATLENYTLEVAAPTATLTAASVYGALRGLETFAQLQFDSSTGGRLLPSVSVQDAPRYGYRAIMVRHLCCICGLFQ